MQNRSPFSYGKKVDRTIFWLTFALIIVFPICLSFCFRPRNRVPALDDVRQLTAKTTLRMLDNAESNIVLKKGEKVTVLGHKTSSYYDPFMLWIQTADGDRGYIPVEAVDNRAVLSPEYTIKKDETSFEERYRNDTVRIIGWAEMGDYNVQTSGGEKAKVDADALRHMFAGDRKHMIRHDQEDVWRPMSLKKFQKMYMNTPLAEADDVYLPAHFLIRRKDGSGMAVYPVKVLVNGAFYTPVVNYGKDGNPTEYIIPEKAESTVNKKFIRLLPFYGSVVDLPFVWPLWTEGIYSTVMHAPHNSSLLMTIFIYLCFLPLGLIMLLFPPLLIPLIVFGLLRFPGIFRRISNSKMKGMIKTITYICVLLWIFLSLTDMYLIPLLIGEFIVMLIFFSSVNKVLAPGNPEVRCPDCAMLYSSEYDRRVEEGDRVGAIEQREYLEDDTVTSVERWQTWTEVTTTYGDGHKSTHRENVKNHERKHGIRTYGIYSEAVEYVPYTTYYICGECGHIEREYSKDRVLLKRVKIRSYQETY